MIKRLLIIFVCLAPALLNAQNKSQIYIDGLFCQEVLYVDTISLLQNVRNITSDFVRKGHFFSGVDSIKYDSGISVVYLHKGGKYKNLIIDGETIKRPINYLETKLNQLTSNGYPFASLMLLPTLIDKTMVSADLLVAKGPYVVFDSLVFLNQLRPSKNYISNLTGIKFDKPYDESTFSDIQQSFRTSNVYSLKSSPIVSFYQSKAVVSLDVEERNSNSFDGLIGLQQNGLSSSILVGNLNLTLGNLFQSEKRFSLQWSRFDENSQKVALAYAHPFLFNSNLSPNFNFNLLRQDTLFLSTEVELKIESKFFGKIVPHFGFKSINSSVITNDEDVILTQDLIDYTNTFYEFGLRNNQTIVDRLENYLEWNFSLGMGNKNLNRNINLPQSYYDSIQLDRNLLNLQMSMSLQQQIFSTSSLFTRANYGYLKNQSLFTNELYRLGGLNTIRGFNELQYFADQYLFTNLEYRLFFESSSYLFLFYDQLFYSNSQSSDQPFGVGLGMTIATQAGQFKFVIASGKSNDLPISFSNAKIHFGYTSTF